MTLVMLMMTNEIEAATNGLGDVVADWLCLCPASARGCDCRCGRGGGGCGQATRGTSVIPSNWKVRQKLKGTDGDDAVQTTWLGRGRRRTTVKR